MTDALRSLLKGEWKAAWAANPNIIPFSLWVLFTALLPIKLYLRFTFALKRYRVFEVWLIFAILGWFKHWFS